jgi:hypothetical protein
MQNTEKVWKKKSCFRKENLRNVCNKTNHTVTCRKNSFFLSFFLSLVSWPFLPTHFRFRGHFALDHTRWHTHTHLLGFPYRWDRPVAETVGKFSRKRNMSCVR